MKHYIAMKKILVSLALACLTICSYAQRDVPAGGFMEVASVEVGAGIGDNLGVEKQLSLYKVKDKEGNPAYFLCISNVMASLTFGTADSNTSFSIPTGGVILDFGTTYEDALGNLNEMLDIFAEDDGFQKEYLRRNGETTVCTLHKGLLGKHLSIEKASISKSDVKSLRTSLKISKKLHPDL